ncbi:MAG: hypothetical protein E4G94_04520 [ANME-2 cluster archaeon]|nr:MAG: hypothetical protein E4G94_04520 [ANME-2 cluster archaeon]
MGGIVEQRYGGYTEVININPKFLPLNNYNNVVIVYINYHTHHNNNPLFSFEIINRRAIRVPSSLMNTISSAQRTLPNTSLFHNLTWLNTRPYKYYVIGNVNFI